MTQHDSHHLENQRVHVDHPAGHADDTGIFDRHHPPSDELISDCVHCGFCLPTCPTYVLWERRWTPRGPHLPDEDRQGGQVPLDDTYAQHFDACLGCMACVTACPSGVQYDKLIEAVRPQLERNHPRRWDDRAFRALIFSLFPYPSRLRVAAVFGAAYERIGGHRLLERSRLLTVLPSGCRPSKRSCHRPDPDARHAHPRLHPCGGHHPAARRFPDRLRAARLLRRRQRRDRPRPHRRGLRCHSAASATLLRRAQRTPDEEKPCGWHAV